jgi:hypothetical protein
MGSICINNLPSTQVSPSRSQIANYSSPLIRIKSAFIPYDYQALLYPRLDRRISNFIISSAVCSLPRSNRSLVLGTSKSTRDSRRPKHRTKYRRAIVRVGAKARRRR